MDARYATVGFDDPSNRSVSASPTADSPIPVIRTLLETIASPVCASSSGTIVPVIISTISSGTPGTA
jgi:hypothetical protein